MADFRRYQTQGKLIILFVAGIVNILVDTIKISVLFLPSCTAFVLSLLVFSLNRRAPLLLFCYHDVVRHHFGKLFRFCLIYIEIFISHRQYIRIGQCRTPARVKEVGW